MGWWFMEFFSHREKIESAKAEFKGAVDNAIKANQDNIRSSRRLMATLGGSGNASIGRILKGIVR